MENIDSRIKDIVTKNIKEPMKYELKIKNALEDDKIKKYKYNRILHTIISSLVGIFMTAGVVFAGTTAYEKIWKEPERITLKSSVYDLETISEENISEEEAKIIAEQKLKEFKIIEEIANTDKYSIQETGEVYYRFLTSNWQITIKGFGGKFFDLWSNKEFNTSYEKVEISKQEAIEIANQYYKDFGFVEGGYKMRKVSASMESKNWEPGNAKGYRFDFEYNKYYGELYNPYESITISIYAKNNALNYIRVENKKCDNNPIEITKEEAIEIAKEEDRKVESCDIVEVEAETRIEKMNGNAYARLHNTEEYYKPMTETDVPQEKVIAYKTANRIRKVWVVVLKYGEGKVENFGENLTQEQETENLMNRYVKGQYTYFIDGTTGEIIGGDNSDYLRWDNLWNEQYKV